MSRTACSILSIAITTCLLMPVIGFSGCGYSAQDLALNHDEARNACQTFLTSWQNGATSKSLEPGLIGTDEDWSSGQKLVSFEVLPEQTNDGTNLHIPVRLKLADASGKESAAEVIYCVGTSPVVTVFRD